MIAVGAQVEKYVVESELGGGGMAKVYKVRHGLLGSTHALKVLNPDLVRDEELRGRFLSEGQIQARLRHPNIVAVTDIVAVPGIAGLVMDFIEGPTLEEFIQGLGTPPPADLVRDLFGQVLAGVGYAHRHGVIHRDIKPANVLLESKGAGHFHARILDFGIAKVGEGEPGNKRATRAGARMGTPHYMSPEQVRGARDVSPRSDIFSLGASLYELATGRVAFDGDSDYDIHDKIVRGLYEKPERIHPGIDRKIAAAIVKALEPDPERRFPSCEAFAEAITGAPTAHGGAVRSPTSGSKAVPLLVAMVVLLAAGGAGPWNLLQPGPPSAAPVAAPVVEKPPTQNAPPVQPPPPEVVAQPDPVPTPEPVPPPPEPEPAVVEVVPEPPKPKEVAPNGMVAIEAATFRQGRDPYGAKAAFDVPAHEVKVGRFAIGRTEVTVGEFKKFVDATGVKDPLPAPVRRLARFEPLPVVNIDYALAEQFCRWLYPPKGRLPTESEWELAARGTEGRMYPWGNAWRASCANALKGEKGTLSNVGSLRCGATPEGIVDLAGNAWEWTSSAPTPYPGSTARLPETGFHVIRGGSFFNTKTDELTATVRRFANKGNAYLGFRCAVSLDG